MNAEFRRRSRRLFAVLRASHAGIDLEEMAQGIPLARGSLEVEIPANHRARGSSAGERLAM